MKLFLIRHGQTVGNVERIYIGQHETPLTEEGRAQAKAIAPILAKIPFDRVYSSDLSRAADTQKLALPQYNAILTPLLREVEVGSMTGQHWDQIPAHLEEEFRLHKDYGIFGGESTQELCARVARFTKLLEEDPCDYVAAFSHNGAMNAVLQNVLGANIDKSAIFNKNCAINVYEYDGQKWRLLALNYMREV